MKMKGENEMNISLLCPILVLTVGTYLLFKLKFFFIFRSQKTAKAFIKSQKSPESRRALFLALAGTLGVGNIFGVAAGIIYGGAGSVFWLAVSALFSSVLKYAECALAFDTLDGDGGGMHLVILKTFGSLGRPLSLVYAASCTLIALFMGGAMQSSAAVNAYSSLLQKSPTLPSIIFALLVFVGILGGGRKIEKVTEKVIPLTMIVYIFLCFAAIFANFASFGKVISLIIREALKPRSAAFGIGMHIFLKQFSEGFCRGILSNEAGCGTSSLAHARASERTPFSAGLSGMCEVFFDTSLLCILTALAILCSVASPSEYSSPMSLVSDSIGKTLGTFSGALLILTVASFAYSTAVCWFYYGTVTSSYLAPKFGNYIFSPLFFAFLVFGVNIPSRTLIEVTDVLLLTLCLLTTSALIKNRDRIIEITEI